MPRDGAKARFRRLRLPRLLRHGLTIFILVLVIEYFVIPQLVNARKSLTALEHVNIALLLLGLALEIAAQLAYARLTIVLLPPKALSYSKTVRINMSALGVSHILPGGTAGGTGLGYLLMTSNGVKGADVGFAAATQGIGSAIVLNALLWLALLISIPLNGYNPIYLTVAIVGAVLLTIAAALILAFTKGQAWAIRVLRATARRVPKLTEDGMEQLVHRVAGRLRALAADRRMLAMGVGWAATNWLLDAACLWICLTAFHQVLDPIDLLVAYGVGNVLAAIPVTPGGLGPVEWATGFALRGFGVPSAIAALGVLAWRLYNFWLPIPLGAGCYVSLRMQRGSSMREQRGMLRSLPSAAKHANDEEPAVLEPAIVPLPHRVEQQL
ncbi:MAG: lysylphosphatidylglycerol synthase transmembrane domain-containing protein [Acidimicrobiales bacterium]